MDDIKDLKQLVENVKANINNIREKDNKHFSYYNNGDLIGIIIERFIKENITEEVESQIINNNIETEQVLKKNVKLMNVLIPSFFMSFTIALFFTISFIISRFTTIKDLSNDTIVLFFSLSILTTIIFFAVQLFAVYKECEMIDKNKEYINDKILVNYNNKILKIILSITKDLNLIKSIENAEYIDLINKKLIDDAYLFENGKVDNFIDGSLKNIIVEKLLSIKTKPKKNIEDKMIKKEDFFEDISLEEKVNFLEKKII